ncbi:MAG: 30S ribosomal protein S9 [Patescibacteria group bacterium]
MVKIKRDVKNDKSFLTLKTSFQHLILTTMQDEQILETTETGEQDQEEELKQIPKIQGGKYIEGIGRRKKSTARVRLWANSNKEVMNVIVNGKNYTKFFPLMYLQKAVDAPLRKLRIFDAYKITAITKGGGIKGQAEAIRLGIARALLKLNPEWRQKFKKAGFMTRDPRGVERKKFGLRKARRAPQWHKR